MFGGKSLNLGSAEASETDADKKTDDDKKTIVTDKDGATQKLSDNDLKTMYEDLLPLFKSELSADDDELKRQKFLELAKFGANLLAQPGGDLTGAIGRAAAPSIEGLTRVAETRRRANEAAKTLALEAALKQSDPGTIMKQVKDIMRLDKNISQEDALAKVLSTGSATKQATAQGRVENNAAAILASGTVDNELQAIQIAENIEDAGKRVGDFRKDPGEGERKKGTYYVIKMPDGNFEIGKYKGKKDGKEDFASPGDEDF
jgi:glycerol-3-phosphate dehydrogenase